MGEAMASNLVAAGYDVLVWNRSPAPAERLAERGARVAADIASLARESDVVVTIVTDDAALRAVLDGDDGVLAHAKPGTLVIDMSTVSPALSRELAETAAARGLAILDAPVSG